MTGDSVCCWNSRRLCALVQMVSILENVLVVVPEEEVVKFIRTENVEINPSKST